MSRRRLQRGGVLSGVLIVLLVLIGIAVAGVVLGGLYLARHIRVEESRSERGKSVEVSTPFGSLRVQEGGRLDPAKAGIPVYPGATAEESESKSFSLDLDFGPEHKEVTIIGAHYTTSDSLEKVVEFYRRELPHWIVAKKRRGWVQMEYTEQGYKRFVGISERHGQTRIVLAQVGEPPTV
jgi:hypothetical protein